MDGVEFLRERAAYFRDRAAAAADPVEKEALLDLARRCDELATIIAGRSSGPGRR